MAEINLTRQTPLPFEIELVDGTMVATIGDVEKYMAALASDRRGRSHWSIAIRMMENAFKEPAYLKAATMSFQTALALDGLVARMQG
jgi:hypothetical protein